MNSTEAENLIVHNIPIPACVVNSSGNIELANDLMSEVFLYKDIEGANFFTLTGKKISEVVLREEDDDEIIIGRNERHFALANMTVDEKSDRTVILFENVTEREELKKKLNNDKAAIILVEIDNYEELISSVTTNSKKAVPAEIDRIVRKWAGENHSAITSISEEDYIVISTQGDVNAMVEDSFSVLDSVRGIEAKIDFPISISIGIGMSEESMIESKSLAKAALDLALGRGGDQAVVKTDSKTKFYGGTLQSMEKNNRGKARVIAHALRRLVDDSKRVIIAGHRWPDMDSFGAALGAYRICEYLGKEVHVVVEDYNDALQVIYDHAVDTGEYSIVRNRRALELADKDTLLFIVDNNRPTLVECPELLDVCQRKVIIDHHRTTETPIEGATISYIESYASSTSELMTEIIQYIAPKRIVSKFESEALLAGIMVDTNNYSVRSGVRTFEAAAWLKRSGADAAEVKRFFQTEITAFQAKAEAVANAKYTDDGIAYAMTEGYSAEANIINAQVADELLSVKGIKASFVIGTNDEPRTIISARSLGEINVQTIMEKFGGGGHLTTAAAQVDDLSPDEALEKLKNIIKQIMDKDKEKEENQSISSDE